MADYQCTIEAPVTPGEAFEKISRVPEWWAAGYDLLVTPTMQQPPRWRRVSWSAPAGTGLADQ